MIYYIAYFLIILSGAFHYSKGKKTKELCIWIPFLIMLIIAGFRSESVGADTLHYDLNNSNRSASELFDSNFIYNIYAFVILRLFNSFLVFHIITAFIIYYILAKFIKEFSENPALSYCVFFGMGHFFNTMNQHRQYLALSFCMLAIIYLFGKDNKRAFILCSAIAMFIHNVCFVLIAACVVAYVWQKVKLKFLIYVFGAVVISWFFIERAITLFVGVFSSYNIYLNSWVRLFEGRSDIFDYILIFILIIIEFIYFNVSITEQKFVKSQINNKNVSIKSANLLIIINAVNISAKIISTKIYLIIRVALLADPFLMVMIPEILGSIKLKRTGKYMIRFAAYCLLFIYMYITLSKDGSKVLPYKLYGN